MGETRDTTRLDAELNSELVEEFRHALAEDGLRYRDWLAQRIWAYLRARKFAEHEGLDKPPGSPRGRGG